MRRLYLFVFFVAWAPAWGYQVVPKSPVKFARFHPELWATRKPDRAIAEIVEQLDNRLGQLGGNYGKSGEGRAKYISAIKAFRSSKSDASLARVLAARIEAYYSDPTFEKQESVPSDVMDSIMRQSERGSEQFAFLTFAALGSSVVTAGHTLEFPEARAKLLTKKPVTLLEKLTRVQRTIEGVSAARVGESKLIVADLARTLGDCYWVRLGKSWIATASVALESKSKVRVKEVISALLHLRAVAPAERLSSIDRSLKGWRLYLASLE